MLSWPRRDAIAMSARRSMGASYWTARRQILNVVPRPSSWLAEDQNRRLKTRNAAFGGILRKNRGIFRGPPRPCALSPACATIPPSTAGRMDAGAQADRGDRCGEARGNAD